MKPEGGLRYVVAAASFAMAFMALGGATVHVALAGGPTSVSVPSLTGDAATGPRSDIVDRNGEILASTLATHSLFADPTRVWDAEETAEALARTLPGLDVADTARRLEEGANAGRRFVWLQRNLTPRQRQAVFDLGLAGLDFVEEPRRVYPRGRLAAHVLGWTNIDGEGAAGAERAFDAELSRGDRRPLMLSIDLRVQYALDDELRRAFETFRAKAGVGLVSDVRTGEILALVSLPDFDPNHPGDFDDDARFNRAMSAVYELGSIFKTFTVATALDVNAAALDTLLPTDRPLEVAGRTIRDSAPADHELTMAEAFIASSNVGIGALGLSLDPVVQRDYLGRFGLLDRAPVDYLESARPLIPAAWGDSERATVSFGHGIAVSPVSFLAGFDAAVNGGRYVRPTLRPVSARGAVSDPVISPETSAEVSQLLRAVVAFGTGRRAEVSGLGVGGKTGTAEKPVAGGYDEDRIVASFAAVFPFEDPRYAILILLDEPRGTEETHGRAGAGYTAAPTAAAVAARIAPLLGVAQGADDARLSVSFERTSAPAPGGALEDEMR
jgi:cell division protein FtsI (penicillin-binding protein 3)